MSSNKTRKSKTAGSRSGGGGFRCCREKATDIIQPTPKSKAASPSHQEPTHAEEAASATGTLPKINDSLVVVDYSDDPYRDFRQSMLQMIRERDIRSRDDLQQLLECLLELNSPHHHEIIVRAFNEICNGGGDAAALDSPAAV